MGTTAYNTAGKLSIPVESEAETPTMPKKQKMGEEEERVAIELDEQIETIATNNVLERSGVGRATSASISNTHATV